MSAFSHAILYTLLLGASVITGLFSYEGRTSLNTQGLEALEIVEAYAESSPLEEVEIAVEREEYRTDEIAVELILENGEKMKMGLEEYVAGVLLAEMPSWYSEEALKAAAVAVRTYTVYKLEASGHICTRPSHCQAFYAIYGERKAPVRSMKKCSLQLNPPRVKYFCMTERRFLRYITPQAICTHVRRLRCSEETERIL